MRVKLTTALTKAWSGQRPPTAVTHAFGQPRRHSLALCSGASPSASASTPRPYTATLPSASGRTASASSDTAASCSMRPVWSMSFGTGCKSPGGGSEMSSETG
ncbi:hypothetical protein OV079_52325 [Nannocystis pusilla]|uniref:Uncharacterized protein n=1 Tax=Nannocystis pusilla TaxID=889268 RepID=A0A9X3J3N6_9BACT|nr:hypothetical protein [Nannocystis pusilla]MCY1013976.1 hypothetical protein [Nannocystis pusilla]